MDRAARLAGLEALLQDNPADAETRYAVALEHASGGDDARAAAELATLMRDTPNYVPAYLMAGQILARLGRTPEAVDALRAGVTQAEAAGNGHAAGEMQGLLDGLI